MWFVNFIDYMVVEWKNSSGWEVPAEARPDTWTLLTFHSWILGGCMWPGVAHHMLQAVWCSWSVRHTSVYRLYYCFNTAYTARVSVPHIPTLITREQYSRLDLCQTNTPVDGWKHFKGLSDFSRPIQNSESETETETIGFLYGPVTTMDPRSKQAD